MIDLLRIFFKKSIISIFLFWKCLYYVNVIVNYRINISRNFCEKLLLQGRTHEKSIWVQPVGNYLLWGKCQEMFILLMHWWEDTSRDGLRPPRPASIHVSLGSTCPSLTEWLQMCIVVKTTMINIFKRYSFLRNSYSILQSVELNYLSSM